MNRRTKSMFKNRIFAYLHDSSDMERDKMNKVAQRIVDDFEIYVKEINNKLRSCEENLAKLRKKHYMK